MMLGDPHAPATARSPSATWSAGSRSSGSLARKCGRAGRYRLERLTAQHGPDAKIPDWIAETPHLRRLVERHSSIKFPASQVGILIASFRSSRTLLGGRRGACRLGERDRSVHQHERGYERECDFLQHRRHPSVLSGPGPFPVGAPDRRLRRPNKPAEFKKTVRPS